MGTNFDHIKEDPSWSFEGRRSFEQFTHGYHRYPAKFLPDVVSRLIERYAIKGAVIADPFAGCGTTLVEAKMHGYASVGVDINRVAELIARVKITPIDPSVLKKSFETLVAQFSNYVEADFLNYPTHERIDYWFFPQEKYKIAFLYRKILDTCEESTKDFFLVSLSHILKNCSKWLQDSTKPQVDPHKKPADPFVIFQQHTKQMLQKNEEYYDYLKHKDFLGTPCEIQLGDARKTGWADESIGTIITSPPYVTSYEYADIHQLTGYWYEYFEDLAEYRKQFIGTSYPNSVKSICVNSTIGQAIVDELIGKKACGIARNVANYVQDMEVVAEEMYRVLQPDGRACVVIGNTTVRGVHIRSAELFWELMQKSGFKRVNIIKRNIPHKLMPTIRDTKSGRFTKVDAPNSKIVYPNEYIIIAKK